jgi:hypothetical protein
MPMIAAGSLDTASFVLQLAAQMLTRYGQAAIWKLHVAAAARYLAGDPGAAETLIDAAEIVEGLWLGEEPLI